MGETLRISESNYFFFMLIDFQPHECPSELQGRIFSGNLIPKIRRN